ncbi:MAG: hypothetical protein PHI31_14015 [Desulfuromonadaceae bacterium]|nr:hypothetical protein [Desulfuromonadaceae bacterium]
MKLNNLEQLNEIAKQFNKSVHEYLEHVKPKYNREKKCFDFNEREIQAFFWNKLFKIADGEYRIKIEERYSKEIKQRFDLMIEYDEHNKNNLFIEIEWSAKQTDGFGTHTFGDLEKLSRCTPSENYGMFLAVNISDKYTESNNIKEFYCSPYELPLRKQSALRKVWVNSEYSPLIQSHSKFWLSEYPHEKGKDNKTKYYVLVFACFGKKNKIGNWEKML